MSATARFTPTHETIEPAITVLPAPPSQTSNQKSAIPATPGRLSLNLKKKVSKTESCKPAIPDPTGELGKMAHRIRERREQVEALEGAIENDSAEVTLRAFPHYLAHNQGRSEPDDSFLIPSESGPAMILFPNRYPKIKEAAALDPLRAVLGGKVDELFKTRTSVTVDFDAIPPERQQTMADALVNLFSEHGCENALSMEEITKPVPEFHATRHRLLDPAANQQLQQLFPISGSIKTKGVKG